MERSRLKEAKWQAGKEDGFGKGRASGKRGMRIGSLAAFALAGAACLVSCGAGRPKGCQEYTVQLEQYYVEYSEKYDYWDVLTVEYPKLDGIDGETQEGLNQQMYDMAMDRVNYWHLFPNEDVKRFQEEHYSIFCSDVDCDVTFHSQYLLSLDYFEFYCAGNPVWMTNGTERALTVDLLTGEAYGLEDIVEINRDFIETWDRINSEEEGEEASDAETLDIIWKWFLQEDEEMNEIYECRPFFYVTQDKGLVIGLSMDPKLEQAVTYEPLTRSVKTYVDAQALEPYKKESEFWEKLEASEEAGEVIPCADKKENIWLGEDAGIWQED